MNQSDKAFKRYSLWLPGVRKVQESDTTMLGKNPMPAQQKKTVQINALSIQNEIFIKNFNYQPGF